jgi:hypothetical protein
MPAHDRRTGTRPTRMPAAIIQTKSLCRLDNGLPMAHAAATGVSAPL